MRGFTLLELIVVVFIIAVFASIVASPFLHGHHGFCQQVCG